MSAPSSFNSLIKLRDFLCSNFVSREQEITSVLAGLISGEPVILVGSPGTAKTKLIETLAKASGCKYFYYLLTRFTEPDEILGSLDINALRKGEYRRITSNRLPEAEIIFLDEIFKASSAIRNILLDILLNKRYLNGAEYKQLPAIAFYFASNEISYDSEDAAFYDRITIRCFVNNVPQDQWLTLFRQGAALESLQVKQIITKQEILQLQQVVHQKFIQLSQDTSKLTKLVSVLADLPEISDRRKIKLLKVAAAISIIYFEQEISLDSLADAVKLVCPHDSDQVKKIEEVIMKHGLSSFAVHVQQISTVTSELKNMLENAKKNPSIDNLKALNSVMKKALQIASRTPRNPRLLQYLRDLKTVYEDAKNFSEQIKEELFGGMENEASQ